MRNDEDRLPSDRPALIVRSGHTRKKIRPLTGQVMVLGRSASCDLGLVSPEVAPVHCVIIKLPQGWLLRDCSGRGTRINGKPVHEEWLNNSDVIQLGAFSFEAHLPGQKPVVKGGEAPAAQAPSEQLQRLERSRQNFARLAIDLRRRLRERHAAASEAEHRAADLERLERKLRQTHQELIAQQRKQEQDLKTREEQLETRSRELDSYADHLRRLQAELRRREEEQMRLFETDRTDYEAELLRFRQELHRDRQALDEQRDRLEELRRSLELAEQKARATLAEERQALAREREQLAEEAEDEPLIHTPGRRHTQLEAAPDRLESAKKLLRDLTQRRKKDDSPLRQPAIG